MSSSYSTSSRARSSSPSPFSHRKPHLSSSSSSTFSATRIVPRSSPSSVSSHFPRSLTPTRGRAPVLDDLLANHDARSGDTISVTVRFRPLSEREFQRGDEIAWYPDGEKIVRSEYYQATAYAFDRVFGPATGSKDVYDVSAQPVVRAAMDGINGTVFAYGVTSSGKTHTMHGDHNSPGIIPLAIKDVFSMIQDTPGREFLLRVSYIEIYNEIINDLLDPTGQNLRVREDAQGTYVEGIKEEVVLSPGHALSFIASGEEHRHVGSNNFNLFSSRSHTIFTLMIESSAHGDDYDGVTFSQLNLIDLAGSESSKTETTGVRRKEGSYINKSLLTLGTVIGKLSEGRASHVPYRDSKLTRLLQSSLSGHGHVSLICTITPASSNTEETHNTLKFASRAKRVEISASRNRIIDEKSLIKKYQKEISTLKQELDQLKKGVVTELNHEEILSLRQKLEEGQVKMQSRLEEEEDAKAALMSRIQRLTKLILVSSKNSIPGCLGDMPSHQRHQSICDDDKSGLRDASPLILENGAQQDSESLDVKHQRSSSKSNDEQSSICSSVSEVNHGGENAHGYKITMAGMLTSDQVDLLSEQIKMLADEIGLSISSLKRLKEQSINDPEGSQMQQIQNLENEIQEKQRQVRAIEQQLIDNNEASMANSTLKDLQQTVMKLTAQCNEKGFELELRTADNRILQEQLQKKCSENEKLQEKVCCLEQQLTSVMGERSSSTPASSTEEIDALKRKVLSQDADNENLNLEKLRILEEYSGLQIQNQKLAEEASYAKELASAAAVELKNLAEEVTKLSLQNAIQAKELLTAQDMAYSRSASLQAGNGFPRKYSDSRFDGKRRPSGRGHERGGRIHDDNAYLSNELDEVKMELQSRKQREAALEGALREKELAEEENKRKYDEAKRREAALENELAGMWVLVAKLKKGDVGIQELNGHQRFGDGDFISDQKENKYENNEIVINQKPLCDGSLKPNTDVHNTHSNMEPLLLRLKAQIQEMKEKKTEPLENGDADSHLCKVCFEAPSADVLLPCRHFCLCRPCSLACSECPVCRTEIVDRIITYTS